MLICWVFSRLNILLTRPLAQVKSLQALVAGDGHHPILFPTLDIRALDNKPRHTHYDVVIFISANAVDYGKKVLSQLNSQTLKIFAVGAATAKRLQTHGYRVDGFPEKKASSEALLAMDAIKRLSDQRILIFRGKGGRETLKQGLGLNNTVEYVEVYERIESSLSELHHQSLGEFLSNTQGIVTITSIENLDALLAIGHKIKHDFVDVIKHYPIVVLSSRIEKYAKSMGFSKCYVAKKTSDQGLIDCIDLIL